MRAAHHCEARRPEVGFGIGYVDLLRAARQVLISPVPGRTLPISCAPSLLLLSSPPHCCNLYARKGAKSKGGEEGEGGAG